MIEVKVLTADPVEVEAITTAVAAAERALTSAQRAESAANRSEQSLSGIVAQTEESLAAIRTAEEDAVDTVQTLIDTIPVDYSKLTKEVEHHDYRITNLEMAGDGYLYRMLTDASALHRKAVPAEAMPYASLDRVGGCSLAINQKIGAINNTNWALGSATVQDGVCTYTPTAEVPNVTSRSNWAVMRNHRYYLSCEVRCDVPTDQIQVQMRVASATGFYTRAVTNWQRVDGILISTVDASSYMRIYDRRGENFTPVSFRNPMIIDLTQMFGSGREPDVETMRQLIPVWLDRAEGTLMHFTPTAITAGESRVYDLGLLKDTYFPDGMKSAGGAYDECDLEQNKAIRRVDVLTDWSAASAYTGQSSWVSAGYTGLYIALNGSGTNGKLGVMSIGEAGGATSAYANQTAPVVWMRHSSRNTLYAQFRNDYTGCTNVTALKEWATAHAHCTYQLMEETVTDIAEPLPEYIEVTPGDSLVIDTDSADFGAPVPSQQTYMIKLGGVN